MSEFWVVGWLWFGVGLTFMLAELFFLKLWLKPFAIAAIVTSIMVAVLSVGVFVQIAVFIISLGVALYVYFRWQHVPIPSNATQKQVKLAPSTVGMQASLLREVRIGRSTAQLKDSIWVVRCEKILPPGTLVTVTGYRGVELDVTPVNSGVS